jgi:hypothetical protein
MGGCGEKERFGGEKAENGGEKKSIHQTVCPTTT